MNVVITALSVLSSITGFASGQRYDTNENHLQDLLTEHFGELSPLASEDSILMSDDVYDMGGSNRYLLLSFIDGKTVIYDKKDEAILETYDVNPYSGHDDEFKLLGNIEDEYMFGFFDEEINDFSFINNTSRGKEDIREYYGNQAIYSYGNYYMNVAMPDNVHIIDNAFYFEKLGSKHAPNDDGTCAVISAEILFGYYDTFLNDSIVAENFDKPTSEHLLTSNPSVRDFRQSPSVDTGDSNDETDYGRGFHDYLCYLSLDRMNIDPRDNGLNVRDQKALMRRYLDERGLTYQTRCSEGNLGDLIANKAKTVIKDAINQNRPVIACGEGHASVAYAYSDTMVWVHTGWGFTGATPWRTFESSMFQNYYSGAIDFTSIAGNKHVCSDNYFASNISTYICPKCGKVYKLSEVNPSSFNLSTTYFSSEMRKNVTVENQDVYLNYYRTAMLSDRKFISLSAKRNNEGMAYIDIYVSRAVKILKFELCFYSYGEALNSGESHIYFTPIRRSSEGDLYLPNDSEDLINRSISKNRTYPTEFVYDYTGEEVYGFSLTVTAPATGNSDSGRVCLGNITMKQSLIGEPAF